MLSCWLLGVALAAPADKAPPAAQGPAWETKLYAQPRVGGLLFSDGQSTSTGLSIGAEGGLRYWQVGRPRPVLRGVARVAGDYVLTTSDAAGMELRVGNQIGPYWKSVGLQTGPDLFWNRYSFGRVDLDPTVGLAWPLTAMAWTQGLSVYGGVEPAWLSNADRRVDWSAQQVPGFGHEFTWLGGVGVDVGGLSVSLGYRYRITAGGGQHGLSAGISL